MPGYGSHDILATLEANGLTGQSISAVAAGLFVQDSTLKALGFPVMRSDANLLTMIRIGEMGGLAAPYSGSGLPAEVQFPPMSVIKENFPKWADRVTIDKKDIEGFGELIKANVQGNLGTSLQAVVGNIGQMLAGRMTNRANYLSSEAVFKKTTDINENGCVFSINHKVPDEFRLDLNDSPDTNYADVRDLGTGAAWTPVTWDDHTGAEPVRDIANAIAFIKRISGANVTSILMRDEIFNHLVLNNSIIDQLKHAKVYSMADPTPLSTQLGLPRIVKASSYYTIRRNITAPITASATTFTVDSYSNLSIYDDIRFISADGQTSEYGIISVAPSSTTITVGRGIQNNYASGSYIEVRKNFLPYNKIAFITDAPYQNIIDLPNQMNGNAMAGMSVDIKDESLYAGQKQWGIATEQHMGVYVRQPGGFAAMRVI